MAKRPIIVDFSYGYNAQHKGTFRIGISLAIAMQELGSPIICVCASQLDRDALVQHGLKAKLLLFGPNKYRRNIGRILYYTRLALSQREAKLIFMGTFNHLAIFGMGISFLHDLYVYDMPNVYRPLQYLFYRLLAIPSCMYSERVIVTTRQLQQRLMSIRKCGESTLFRYIPPAIPLQAPAKQEHAILVVAAYTKNKNSELIARAFKSLLGRSPSIGWTITFVTSDVAAVRDLFTMLSVPPESYTVRAGISDSELSELYSVSRFYWTLSEVEGLGLGTREALVHGCQVICLDTPINREASWNLASFLKRPDPEELAELMASQKAQSPSTIHQKVLLQIENDMQDNRLQLRQLVSV